MLYFARIRMQIFGLLKKIHRRRNEEEKKSQSGHPLNKRNEWTHETRNVDERVSRVRRLVGTEGNGCVNAREGS